MNNVAMLPFLPVSSAILAEAKFFLSPNARVVRAGFWMLEAAWRSTQPGSIPSSFESLAVVTRLTTQELHEHYEVLTAGWDLLEDGRLHFLQLETVAQGVQERFGAQLEVFADSALLACQGGNAEFELVAPAEVKKKQRGKHALPKDFSMDRASLGLALAEGYDSDEKRAWLLQQFLDYALSKSVRQMDWQAAFRIFLGNPYTRQSFQAKFGYALGQRPGSGLALDSTHKLSLSERFQRAQGLSPKPTAPVTFAQKAANHNSDLMAQAMARRLEPSASASAGA